MRKRVDFAKVDLGAAHNGRVTWRNVFQRPDKSRYIVDRGKHVTVIRISRSLAGLNYVTAGGGRA